MRFLVQTGEGIIDMSPGVVPANAARINNDIVYISSGPRADFKEAPSIPDWQIFQNLNAQSVDGSIPTVAGYVNLHAEDMQPDKTLNKQAACPYFDNEELPEGALRFGDLYSKVPVALANPGTTNVSYKWIYSLGSSGSSTNEISIQYHSWQPDPEKPDLWNSEFRYFINGVEYWYSGIREGKQETFIAIPGIGNPRKGVTTHRIERQTSGEAEASSEVVFERNVIQRKLVFEHPFSDMEFTPGDSVSFSNNMVWKNSPNDNSHDGETAPLESENPCWVVKIYDPAGTLIAESTEQTGNQLAWNWDSGAAVAALSKGYKTFRLIRKGVPPGMTKPNRAVLTTRNSDETGKDGEESDSDESPQTDQAGETEISSNEPTQPTEESSFTPAQSEETAESENSDEIVSETADSDMSDRTDSDSFKEEVAEYSYEVTASAKAYSAVDTTGTSGDVAFFNEMAGKASINKPFKVRKIYTYTKPDFSLLDADNNKIVASKSKPQYDLEQDPPRLEPAALIAKENGKSYCVVEFKRNKNIDSQAVYKVWGVCQKHDLTSFKLFETRRSNLKFAKGSDTAVYTFKVSEGSMSVPSAVQKFESVKWYYSKVKDGRADSGKLADETGSTFFITLKKPIEISRMKPRKDVLNIACEVAAGQKTDDAVRKSMTGGLWGYLDGNDFWYTDRVTHCSIPTTPPIRREAEKYTRNLYFDLNNSLRDQYLDCKDTSSLAHICCNSLGIEQMVIVTASPTTGGFCTKAVKGFGLLNFGQFGFSHHQVSINPDSNKVYDPTCKFPTINFASNIRQSAYLDLFVDYAAYSCRMEWFNKRKVIVIY
jgi:hypothetical protein